MPKRKLDTSTSVGYRLSSHEKLCAERMKLLLKAIDELRKDVSALKDTVSKGKGAVAVLIGLGTLLVALLGYFNFK